MMWTYDQPYLPVPQWEPQPPPPEVPEPSRVIVIPMWSTDPEEENS